MGHQLVAAQDEGFVKEDPEEVRHLRKVLADYDSGLLTSHEVRGRVQDLVLKEVVQVISRGEMMISIGSHCGPPRPPPTRSAVTVVFHLEDGEIQAIGPVGWAWDPTASFF